MSVGPAKLYHIDSEAGSVVEGRRADLVIFDPKESFIIEEFKSKSQNSPFKGIKLNGKIKYTICNGKVVYSDGEN